MLFQQKQTEAWRARRTAVFGRAAPEELAAASERETRRLRRVERHEGGPWRGHRPEGVAEE